VFPDSLKIPDPVTRLYAFMAAATAAATAVNDDFSEARTNLNYEPNMIKDNSLTTVYCLLRACPEMERFSTRT
jgi:hypothetical protein